MSFRGLFYVCFNLYSIGYTVRLRLVRQHVVRVKYVLAMYCMVREHGRVRLL